MGLGNSISWPTSASGMSFCASSRLICVSELSTVSTICLTANTSIWPVSLLKRLRRSSLFL